MWMQRPCPTHDKRQREHVLDTILEIYPPNASKEYKGSLHMRFRFNLMPVFLFCPFKGAKSSPGTVVVALPFAFMFAFTRESKMDIVHVMSRRLVRIWAMKSRMDGT